MAGPVELPTPAGVDRVDVVSAREMLAAARTAVADADVLIAVAAVADYRPETVATQKIKKQPGADDSRSVDLVPNPDIVATLTAERPGLFSVAFAAETERLLEHARAKLERKGVAMIVANDVSDTTIGFGSDANRVTIMEADREIPLPRVDKDAVARELVAHIAARLEGPAVTPTGNAAGS